MGRSRALNGFKAKSYLAIIVGGLFLLAYYFSLEAKLFTKPLAKVIYDRNGVLLSARLPSDEQWRFPPLDSLSPKMEEAILLQEDRYFHYHWGFNPWSLLRALYWNISKGEIVSGASTISMQTIRLARDNPPRTLGEKLWEIVLATRLEWRYSKEDILKLYLSNAPFGGNVVGLNAASWRYFGRDASHLSWAEAATLAVLPNAPGLINPGKNRALLLAKRNRLLKRLWQNGILSEENYQLAQFESLPAKPKAIPNYAPHLLERVINDANAHTGRTSIDLSLQIEAQNIIDKALQKLKVNRINNAALLLIDNHNAEVLAYVGNGQAVKDHYNDMLSAERSSGSILKPLLYASGLQSGEWLPQQLIRDIPMHFEGFDPKNFDGQFRGMVPADQALAQSLNIPAVVQLKDFGVERFHSLLQESGLSTLHYSPEHYGLSLILGGAEVIAWDLGLVYSAWAQKLLNDSAPRQISYYSDDKQSLKSPFSRAAIWQSFKVMQSLNRPGSERGWQYFQRGPIAWKTGTSFGFRDAWAVGVNPDYTCVVWVGNANGEGSPGLIGAEAAGPILFDFLNSISKTNSWFEAPLDELQEVIICPSSGYLASTFCSERDTIIMANQAKAQKPCTFHREYFVDSTEKYRYTYNCSEGKSLVKRSYFQLPVIEAFYYAKQHPDYKVIPPLAKSCTDQFISESTIDVLFPMENESIFIPKKLGGESSELIVEALTQMPNTQLFWHLNGTFLGETTELHKWSLRLKAGDYTLWLEDNLGHNFKRRFKVVEP
jgi:penicillin-binding protein 1C